MILFRITIDLRFTEIFITRLVLGYLGKSFNINVLHSKTHHNTIRLI